MRYLSWDAVRSLETFLVEDNDDVAGIEIHTGLYAPSANARYGQPETVNSYTLEELAGGNLIQMGAKTLRAVVSNRLYYTDSRNWVYNSGTDAVHIGARRDNGYAYERAVLTFRRVLERVPDAEILALPRFLVRDNERVTGIRILPGSMGVGGSNTSGFSAHNNRIRDYSLEILADGGFLWVEGVSVRALVGDVLYYCRKNSEGEESVFTLNYREESTIFHGRDIAYDTIEATKLVLMLN